jgi:hypothetical protein
MKNKWIVYRSADFVTREAETHIEERRIDLEKNKRVFIFGK